MSAASIKPSRSRLVAVIAAVGGTAVITGASLPWLSVFAGLRSYSGTVGLNGRLLAAGGGLTILLALAQGARPRTGLRYAIGILGFALAAFSAYLLAQLLFTYRALKGSFLPALGPGVFVATAGALLIIGTLLIDAERQPRTRRASRLDGSLVALIALSAGAGSIHLSVAAEHFREYPLFGAFFVVLGLAQVSWAALVAVHGRSRPLLIAATANAAVVALWILSRTTGLPIGPDPGAPEAVGFPDLAATLFELVLITGAACSLRQPRQHTKPAAARLAWILPILVSPATIAAILAAVETPGTS